MRPCFALLLLGAALGSYAVIENTRLLCTVQIHLPAKKAPASLPKLLLLSDLHSRTFGKNYCHLVQKIAAEKPDYIILTGDLVSRTMCDFSKIHRLLAQLSRIAPMIMVQGNHELDLPPKQHMAFCDVLHQNGVHLLDNEILTLNGTTFAGLTLTRSHYRTETGYRNLAECTAEEIRAVLGDCPPNTILLAHNPLFFPAYAQWGAALVLSGHVHGGAVRLPILGGLLSPERRFFPRYSKGVYQSGNTLMAVSGGLGKLRLFNPPELPVISVKAHE